MQKNAQKTISHKISQYWPDLEIQEILAILDQYGSEKYHKEIQRVHLAILKLSDGDLDRLKHNVNVARQDYRDVLAYAEYPEEMKLDYSGKKQLKPEDIAALRKRDREQYITWLEGKREH